MSHTDFTKQTTRSSIKIEFLKMYKSMPLGQISISDLAKNCNISRGTFYLYFQDVHALCRECEKDLIDKMEEGLAKTILCTVGLDFEKYVKSFGEHLKGYTEYAHVLKTLLNGSEGSSFRKTWFESIFRNYEQTIEFSRASSPSQRDNLMRFFAAGQLEILSVWVLKDCRAPAEDIAYISAQVLFQGIF